jgi:hypothetical protein
MGLRRPGSFSSFATTPKRKPTVRDAGVLSQKTKPAGMYKKCPSGIYDSGMEDLRIAKLIIDAPTPLQILSRVLLNRVLNRLNPTEALKACRRNEMR